MIKSKLIYTFVSPVQLEHTPLKLKFPFVVREVVLIKVVFGFVVNLKVNGSLSGSVPLKYVFRTMVAARKVISIE